MKKLLTYLLSMAMVAALAVGGTLAYLKDEDSDVNVMTMGNVYIDQLEYERDKDGNLVEFNNNKPLYPAVYNSKDFDQEGFLSNKVQKWSEIGSQGGNNLFHESITNVQDKFVFVKNTGTSNAYVRNIFAFELGKSTPKELFEEILKININTNNWDWKGIENLTDGITVSMDGTNYYIVTATYKGTNAIHINGVLTPNGITCPSLLQVMMYNTVENEDVQQFGDNYKILVVSQAVQTNGFANATEALNEAFGEITTTNHPWNVSTEVDADGAIVLNNNILTLSNVEEPLKIKGSGTVILDGANIKAQKNAIEILGDVKLEIIGDAQLTGGLGNSGIYVANGASLELTGTDNLTVIGNNGVNDSTGGHGIGGEGTIYIHDLKSLTAEGYGIHGFGIGGESKNITIENTTIKQVQGGFIQPEMVSDPKYGKSEPEGGSAIGSSTNGAVITLNNVVIENAQGGSKAAGIGAKFWTGVTINITNSTIKNVEGGNASAGIGGSRVSQYPTRSQDINITINNSTINAKGGQFGAGIGSGYDTHCTTFSENSPITTINITGNSVITAKGGKYAAGIGTGFHTAGLDGKIDNTVTVNAEPGEVSYKDTYTKAMAVGYGVVDPAREAKDNTTSINYNGVEVGIPSIH